MGKTNFLETTQLRDPPALKIVRRAKSLWEENCYGKSKTLRRVLRNTSFYKEKEAGKGTDSDKLRPWQNTTDSSAVVFLVWKGPLGTLLQTPETCHILAAVWRRVSGSALQTPRFVRKGNVSTFRVAKAAATGTSLSEEKGRLKAAGLGGWGVGRWPCIRRISETPTTTTF